MIFKDSVYVQMHRGYMAAKSRRTRKEVTRQCAGLMHTRTVLGDFDDAVRVLRQLFGDLYHGYSIRPRLAVLVHVIPEVSGGYTPLELRGFRDVARQAGAASVYLLANHPVLTLQQQRVLDEFIC